MYTAVGTPASSTTQPLQQPAPSISPGLGAQSDRVLLPVEQVSRADVAPMHGAMNRRVWVVLKEHVIAAVNPADDRSGRSSIPAVAGYAGAGKLGSATERNATWFATTGRGSMGRPGSLG